jgi:hypothetical protein
MTNAEMLERLSRLSTRALRRNAAAAEETERHWDGLAAGRLDEKPECPFCDVTDGECARCALHVTSPETFCGPYGDWYEARNAAEGRGLKYPLRSKPVRAAAKKMLAHVRRVKSLVVKALEGRS